MTRHLFRGLLLIGAAATPLRAQDPSKAGTGTVLGVVRSTVTQQPVPGAQVLVQGTGAGTTTGDDGSFTLRVTAGHATVLVRRIGFSAATRDAHVRAGVTTRLDFALVPTVTRLNEVVVTGSGAPTERRKLGNTVGTIDARALENAPVQNVSEVLQGREPGVTVLSGGGLPGEGARIRMRGSASLSQPSEAIVYVDGVRVDNGGGFAGSIGGGGGSPSRLDDINPDAIDRIEVLKGAAAATLYGSEASAGVVQIFTRDGTAGKPRWRLKVEQGLSTMPSDRYAPLAGFARRQPQADSLTAFWGRPIRPFEVFETHEVAKLFETGRSASSTLSVSGGSDAATYFVSGRVQAENGPFTGERFRAPGSVFAVAQDLSTQRQANVNLSFVPSAHLRVRTTAAFTDGFLEIPNNNNNIYGPTTSVIRSKPELANASNPTGDPAFTTASEVIHLVTTQHVRRFAGSIAATHQLPWGLVLDGTAGVDALGQQDAYQMPFGWNVNGVSRNNVTGSRSVADRNTRRVTVDAKATWNRAFGRSLTSAAVLGLQGVQTDTREIGGTGTGFPGAGLEVAGAGAEQTLLERALEEVSGGAFIQEQLGWGDFLFVTLGSRYDRHSAFGANTGGAFYPKASISVVPSDMPGWAASPLADVMSAFRIRAAIGRSGLQPGAFDRFTTYAPLSSASGAGVVPANLGNADLRPEVSTESEGGFEIGLWNDRATFEATLWRREVHDLLVARQFAPSGGFRQPQLDNVGRLRSQGIELGFEGSVLRGARLGLELFANGAYLRERIESLGGAPAIKVGYYRYRTFLREGHAPGAFFGAKLLDVPNPIDTDGDGKPDTDAQLLAFLGRPRTPDELRVLLQHDDRGDPLGNYLGKSTPDWTGSFGGTLSLGSPLRFTTLWEFRTGNFHVQNLTGAFQRASAGAGRNIRKSAEVEATLLNPASTPEQRLAAARVWAHELAALSPQDGLGEVERADFLRLRELGVSYTVPPRWLAATPVRSLDLTVAGRNLLLFTRYSGADPEINAIGRGATRDAVTNNFLNGVDAWGVAIPRRLTLSANVGF